MKKRTIFYPMIAALCFGTIFNSCKDDEGIDPPAANSQATLSVDAGEDVMLECGESIFVDATVSDNASVAWSTSGSGTFNDPFVVDPIYIPSQADCQSGSVTLTISATANDSTASDQLDIDFLTNESILVSRQWSLVGYVVDPALDWNGNGVAENDLLPIIESCSLDDFYDYQTDHSYTLDEGTTKCDASDPQQIDTGTWNFNSDETELVLVSMSGFSFEWRVVSLTLSTLVLEEDIDLDGTSYTFTYTFE